MRKKIGFLSFGHWRNATGSQTRTGTYACGSRWDARAHGARITDVDGHEYVDFCLSDTAAMAGHSPAMPG
ncbi:hypothetical protein [Actinoplanes sp. NPDC049316]|uniref:hypothetical protein n=1 Tax=Actinoplanes sp. NPDC049316 TaxID=3154727 RepID=UPI0034326326